MYLFPRTKNPVLNAWVYQHIVAVKNHHNLKFFKCISPNKKQDAFKTNKY